MARKATGVPKEKSPTPLIIAEHLPRDPADLYNHIEAGWTAMKADTTHFPRLRRRLRNIFRQEVAASPRLSTLFARALS